MNTKLTIEWEEAGYINKLEAQIPAVHIDPSNDEQILDIVGAPIPNEAAKLIVTLSNGYTIQRTDKIEQYCAELFKDYEIERGTDILITVYDKVGVNYTFKVAPDSTRDDIENAVKNVLLKKRGILK